MPGEPGLWVVATPLGNLSDLTQRARQALAQASIVLCEDTRRTSRLMSVLGVSGRLERYDAHASDEATSHWVREMQEGATIALVSDAGTPGISDPGARLVLQAREAGVAVTPIPGASAVTALLSVSGIADTSFCFRGFFPRKAGERKEELQLCAGSPVSRAFVWFESPERVVSVLALVAESYPDAWLVAAKELTKVHEEFFTGEAARVSEAVEAHVKREGNLGEWCFVIRFSDAALVSALDAREEWSKTLQCLLSAGISPSEAARRVSHYFGVGRHEVYERALHFSGKK